MKTEPMNRSIGRAEPLHAFFELGVVGMAVLTPDGDWVDVNERLCEMLEYSREELLARRWPELTHPDDLPADQDRAARMLAGEMSGYSMEKRFLGGGGTIVHAIISVACSQGTDGAPDRVYACAVDITDRKRAEAALRESEGRYRTLFETMKQGVVYQDADGHITSANPAAERILGLTVEQMMARTSDDGRWYAVREDGSEFPGSDHPAMVALRTGREIHNVRMGVFNPRLGDRVWINVHAIPQFRPGQREPHHVYTTFEDVTESERARAALAESEGRFRELAEVLPQTVFELDPEGRFLFANRTGLRRFGYEPQELDRLHVLDLFAAEDHERLKANFHRRLSGEQFPAQDYTAMMKDGGRFPVSIHSSPIIREDRAVGLRGIVVDISDRKEWEETLRDSEQRYRTIIETAMDGVMVVDPFSRIREVNEAYCRMTGYTRTELTRMGVADLDALEDFERVLSHIQKVRDIGSDRFETRHRRKDGALIDVEIATQVMDTHSGRLVAFVRDITERKQAEHRIKEHEMQLLHAGRLSTLGEMASGLAHELNQPLSAILSYGDACLRLLGAETPDEPRIRRNLKQAVMQAERAGQIIRRMRALAKRRQPSFTSVDLNETVANVVGLIRGELKQRRIGVSLEREDRLAWVSADPIHIEQVLLNLIRNAMDAMEDNEGVERRLTLRTAAVGDAHVQVEVSDTGAGLPPSHTTRVFEPFFTTKAEGLGIGLSISRSIVEMHGGVLEVRANPERGTTFSFRLPSIPDGRRGQRGPSGPLRLL